MFLNVTERGNTVATFRWIEVRFMETLASWVPTTPEMEVKLLFGGHIWDAAQHADILGKRTQELRLPLQHSVKPASGYVKFLDDLIAVRETNRRIAGFYECALPGMRRRFEEYLQRVDPLLDGPTVRLLDRIMFDMERMAKDRAKLLEDFPVFRLDDTTWLARLKQQEMSQKEIVVAPPARVAEPALVS